MNSFAKVWVPSLKMASKSGISKSDGEFELAMKLFEGEAECKVTSFPSSPRVMKLGLVGNRVVDFIVCLS